MAEREAPTTDQLADELAVIVGEGFAPAQVERLPGLVGLSYVQHKAGTTDPVACLVVLPDVLTEAVRRLGQSQSAEIATFLLGLGKWRGRLAKERRHEAGRRLGVTADSFRRRHERRYLEESAAAVYAIEHVHRLRQAHRELGKREPVESGLAINWLARHETYGRIWTAVWALRADLITYLSRHREHPDDPAVGKDLRSSLWWFARFLCEMDRFVKDYGGLWLLADLDAETEAADATYLISFHTPFSQADDSWLRATLRAAPNEELDPFVERIEQSERGQALLAQWEDWLATCGCLPSRPREECPVHQVTAACETFAKHLDTDWTKIADWYRRPAADLHGTDITELLRRLG